MSDTTSAAPSEREKFEVWLPPYWPRETYRDDEGDELYCDSWVQGAWMGWQGRAAAPTAQAASTAVAEVENLRKALQFYADGDHFIRSDQDAWDTVSGEPPNYWCDEAGTATVEDGSLAKLALSGHVIQFEGEATIASSEQAQAQPAAVAGPIVAYRISDPNEPDLGHWLSEEPGAAWCKSEPLCPAAPTAQAAPVAQGDALTVSAMADVLWTAWVKAEPAHPITTHPVSYMSSFADMARAALAARSQAKEGQSHD